MIYNINEITAQQIYTKNDVIVSMVNDKVCLQTIDKSVEINLTKDELQKYLDMLEIDVDQLGAIDVFRITDNLYGKKLMI